MDTTTEIDLDVATDLDSLNTSMDKVFAHYIFPQQGALAHQLILLPTVVALCGYEFAPTNIASDGSPLCPRCDATWNGR